MGEFTDIRREDDDESKSWVEKNVEEMETGAITVWCGHNFYEYYIPISPNDSPQLRIALCRYCYQQVLGFFVEHLRTIKVKGIK